jgi:hypothetical protein
MPNYVEFHISRQVSGFARGVFQTDADLAMSGIISSTAVAILRPRSRCAGDSPGRTIG